MSAPPPPGPPPPPKSSAKKWGAVEVAKPKQEQSEKAQQFLRDMQAHVAQANINTKLGGGVELFVDADKMLKDSCFSGALSYEDKVSQFIEAIVVWLPETLSSVNKADFKSKVKTISVTKVAESMDVKFTYVPATQTLVMGFDLWHMTSNINHERIKRWLPNIKSALEGKAAIGKTPLPPQVVLKPGYMHCKGGCGGRGFKSLEYNDGTKQFECTTCEGTGQYPIGTTLVRD